MTEQEEFFSPDHNRLLNIATWAKYFAWITLVIYILNSILQVFQYQFFLNNNVQPQRDIWLFLRNNPLEGFNLGIDILTTIIRGTVYYLVLKGISLGLNMIVETDINYRERKQTGMLE